MNGDPPFVIAAETYRDSMLSPNQDVNKAGCVGERVVSLIKALKETHLKYKGHYIKLVAGMEAAVNNVFKRRTHC